MSTTAPTSFLHKVARISVGALEAFAYTLTFVVALVAAVALHLGSPAGRALVKDIVNRALATPLKGKIVVVGADDIGVHGIRGVDAIVTSADGTRVIVAHGISARINPVALVRTLVAQKGDLGLGVFDIDIDSADVTLDGDGHDSLKIADAFQPATPSTPNGPPGRRVDVDLPKIHIRHAWVHGTIPGAPLIDGDVDELHGSVHVAEDVVIDAPTFHVVSRAAPRGANQNGTARFHLVIPGAKGKEVTWSGAFTGDIGGIPGRLTAESDGVTAHGAADFDAIDAAKLRALVPEAPIFALTAVHVKADGPLDDIDVAAHVAIAPGDVDVTGHVHIAGGAVGIKARAEAKKIDVRAFAPEAPASSFDGVVTIDATVPNGGLVHGTFDVAALAGHIAGQRTPPVTMKGKLAQVAATPANMAGFDVSAQGSVLEHGAPTAVTVALHPTKTGNQVDVTTHTVIADLGAIPRLPWLGTGRGQADVSGTLFLDAAGADNKAPKSPRFDATASVSMSSFARGGATMGSATATAKASGTINAPEIAAAVDIDGLSVAGRTFSHATASATGTPHAFDVAVTAVGSNSPDVTARSHLTMGDTIALSDADVVLHRGNVTMHAVVPEVRVHHADIAVRDAHVTGLGLPLDASVSLERSVLFIRASAAGLDLRSAAQLLGVEQRLRAGTAAFNIDAHGRADAVEGRAQISLTQVSFDAFENLGAQLDATMSGRTVTGTVHAELPGVASIDAVHNVIHVGGEGPLELQSWRRAFGQVNLQGRADLARASLLLPLDALPISDLGGILTFDAHSFRASATDDTPDIKVTVETRGLHFGGRAAPDEKRGTMIVSQPSWRVNGLDASLAVDANGSSGFAEVSGRVADARGALITVDAKSIAVPYDAITNGGPTLADRLMRTPVSARIHIPERNIAQFPELVRPGATGFASGDIWLDGSAVAPVAVMDVSARALRISEATESRGLDVKLHGRLDSHAADATLDVGSETESYLHGTMHAVTELDGWLHGNAANPWTASAKATLLHFPLGAFTELANRDIRGRVSGDVELTDYHKDVRLNGSLAFDSLKVGREKFTSATLKTKYDGKALSAHVTLAQEKGSLVADATSGFDWGKELAPSPTDGGATRLDVSAKNLQASFLEPFMSSAVDEIDGILDADAHLALDPGKKPDMSGTVHFHDGQIEASAIGGELHGVNAKLTLTPQGEVKLEDVVALGTTGKVTASGTAHLDGVALVDASATAQIAKSQPLPIAVAGSNLGMVYGRVDLKATTSSDRRATNLQIDVPDLHMTLPDATPHAVQGLDPQPESLHIGVQREDRRFVVLIPTGDQSPKNATPQKTSSITIAVHLGNVEVKRGTEIAAVVGGDPTVQIADKTTMSGALVLKSGKLEVQGKPFKIQRGTVTFVGDPSNPDVNVTASWKAEDGTEVFADYIGPLKTGKVTLRSEPPRPRNEIVALILFGTADGSQATPYAQPQPGGATRAGTAVGGIAAGGINKGLDKITGLDIATKIDTSQANPRPEVEVQIAKDISLELAVVLGTPPPGTNQDTTYVTIDWRFHRNWSLATTFGNLGSSIADIIWRHRY